MDDFLANEAKGTKVIGAHSLEEMVSKLKKPRRIILLVKAGSAVDDFINKLVRRATFLGGFLSGFGRQTVVGANRSVESLDIMGNWFA